MVENFRVGETRVGEMGIGEMGVSEMGTTRRDIRMTRLCNILQFFTAVKMVIQMKKCDIFLIFAQNIESGEHVRTAIFRAKIRKCIALL